MFSIRFEARRKVYIYTPHFVDPAREGEAEVGVTVDPCNHSLFVFSFSVCRQDSNGLSAQTSFLVFAV